MKAKLILALVLSYVSFSGISQDEDVRKILDDTLGFRLTKNGQDIIIYADNGLKPNMSDYRKLHSNVYFRMVNLPSYEKDGKKYQMITIPGNIIQIQPQANKNTEGIHSEHPRAGESVNYKDYDRNFWVLADDLKGQFEVEHYKYRNQPFSGALTAPFKYRMKLGSAPDDLIDGDFNVATFFGWKWRISPSNPHFIAPFVFGGFTTLDFNSTNNARITDPNQAENGSGLVYGFGLGFEFGSITPGIIIGWDKAFGNLGSGFIYSDKAWISFSLNYDFLKPKKDAEGRQ